MVYISPNEAELKVKKVPKDILASDPRHNVGLNSDHDPKNGLRTLQHS